MQQTDSLVKLTDASGAMASYTIADAIANYATQTGTTDQRQAATLAAIAQSLSDGLGGTVPAANITIGIDFVGQVFTGLTVST